MQCCQLQAANNYALWRATENSKDIVLQGMRSPTKNTSLGEISSVDSSHAAVRQSAARQQHPQRSRRVACHHTWGMGSTLRKQPLVTQACHPMPASVLILSCPAERWNVPKCHGNSFVPSATQNDITLKLDWRNRLPQLCTLASVLPEWARETRECSTIKYARK